MANIYSEPANLISVNLPSSRFDYSNTKKLTTNFGLINILDCFEVLPRDKVKYSVRLDVTFNPLLAPIKHDINAKVWAFHVPYRILWPNWTEFISGGKDGNFTCIDIDIAGSAPSLNFNFINMSVADIKSSMSTMRDKYLSWYQNNFDNIIPKVNSFFHFLPYTFIFSHFQAIKSFSPSTDILKTAFDSYLNKVNLKGTIWDQLGMPIHSDTLPSVIADSGSNPYADCTPYVFLMYPYVSGFGCRLLSTESGLSGLNSNYNHYFSNPSKNNVSSPLVFPWLAYHFIYYSFFCNENLTILENGTPFNPNTFNIWNWYKDLMFNYSSIFNPNKSTNEFWYLLQSPQFLFLNANSSGSSNNALRNYSTHFQSIINKLRRYNWERDYFTASLPWLQRGTAPAISIDYPSTSIAEFSSCRIYQASFAGPDNQDLVGGSGRLVNFAIPPNNNGFNVNDLRTMFAVQRFMEKNGRSNGIRYDRFLYAHWRTSPNDRSLQLPQYLGGASFGVLTENILQTSGSTEISPQAQTSGYAHINDEKFIFDTDIVENGLIMVLGSFIPRASYQQGIHRSWLKSSLYDFAFPDFVHLQDQGIYNSEIYSFPNIDAVTVDSLKNTPLAPYISKPFNPLGVFGFQGRYDELRQRTNTVCGDFRDVYDYWHLGRKFSYMPSLNQDFISIDSNRDGLNRIFAVQDNDNILVSCSNLVSIYRCLPHLAEPGLIDH